ncbi:nucleoside phosphorylase [Opitutus terrae]|uniref:Purine or other phosphorylase family 1 n=1 Tax=Opitutus terrae (strain DSM 11246 / JCM 15787 / PB90-1) TaxID=452637 RepID=B1ZQ06_OPITP|nr:nucleoside phosphorylase [Opitutus terrae]ACB77725.1 purine or other phosphorylase family 1 [Opitutus terrae PB90-1]
MSLLRDAKTFAEPSVFTPNALLREARRQKRLPDAPVPAVCLLDPDGDIARMLRASGRATIHEAWPCYHTEMLRFSLDGIAVGLVPCAVGASFAVLIAEQLFAAGCELLISVTSAGQLSDQFGSPPYFVLIQSAWRDEGTSHHYVPPAEVSGMEPSLLRLMERTFSSGQSRVHPGSVWTTDAPYRETASAIAHFRARGAVAVEMEAAALYAFAEARRKPVVCFAHVTNQMAARDGDFEKGDANGAHDALEVVRVAMGAWLREVHSPRASTSDPSL